MQDDVYAFLNDARIGVIAVEMTDGAPHAATVHFAYQKEPLAFLFLTDSTSRKVEPLIGGASARASLVIGTDEAVMRTLQMDGSVKLTESEEHKQVYFATFPEKREKFNGPNAVFFVFEPSWWRYTDYKAPGGKKILSSDSVL